MYWKKLSHTQIKERVAQALSQNLDYRKKDVLGLPATYLDPEVFYQDAPFLKDAPYMQTMIANPNHIGCHTLSEAEDAFSGTQAIEKELIDICAREMFQAEEYDGYVASGGTEANIEALWILRNYFLQESLAVQSQKIGVIFSEDTHYSIPKGINLLQLHSIKIRVNSDTRLMEEDIFKEAVAKAKDRGVSCFILIMNMSTTMFGSVDDIGAATQWMQDMDVPFKVHVDGAYGGFIYPFSKENHEFTFENPFIHSISLDAHKLVQSPYGTGIFLVRKGMMQYALTEDAKYVKGKDYTLIGSRSGANAIAVWMILRTYGSDGWKAKTLKLIDRTERLCSNLDERNIRYFRHPHMNIVTIDARHIPESLAHQFMLVPETHEGQAQWYKIVVMDHVTQGKLDKFLFALDGLS